MKIIFSQLLLSLFFGLIGVAINHFLVNNETDRRMVLVWATSLGSFLIFNIFLISFWYIPKRITGAVNRLEDFQKKNDELREIEAVQEIDIETAKQTHQVTETPTNTAIISDKQSFENIDESEERDHIGIDLLPRLHSIPETTVNDAQDDLKKFVKRISISKTEANAITEMRRHSFQQKGKDGKRHSVELYDILLNDIGFKQFMNSLAKDLSTECLLCFVEVVQFKFLMKQRFDIVKPGAIPADMGFTDQYPLYGIVPMSEINRKGFNGLDLSKYHQGNGDHEEKLIIQCKKIVHRIYKKYIRTGAELRVNISEEMRHGLKVKIGDELILLEKINIKPEELFTIYDQVAATMLTIMKGFPTFQTALSALGNENDESDKENDEDEFIDDDHLENIMSNKT
eukprot:715266_1